MADQLVPPAAPSLSERLLMLKKTLTLTGFKEGVLSIIIYMVTVGIIPAVFIALGSLFFEGVKLSSILSWTHFILPLLMVYLFLGFFAQWPVVVLELVDWGMTPKQNEAMRQRKLSRFVGGFFTAGVFTVLSTLTLLFMRAGGLD